MVDIPGLGFGTGDIPGLGNLTITTMQDMTPGLCNLTPVGTKGRLLDRRDNKVYWVAKLNDGLCWMTQNLDLDLTTSGLTASLSDMNTDWNEDTDSNRTNPTNTIQAGNLTTTNWPNSGENEVRSYDPGYNVFTNGITSKPATEDLAKGKASEGFTIEDAHYLQGNYYTFNAATAGSGKNKTANDTTGSDPATDSICPKGWKLPIGGSSNSLSTSAVLGSFGKMLDSQGIASSAIGFTNISKPEYSMYFVRGGVVGNGLLNNTGGQGRYWSSTAYDPTQAYNLYFYDSTVNPSSSYNRYRGFSVRCVAR